MPWYVLFDTTRGECYVSRHQGGIGVCQANKIPICNKQSDLCFVAFSRSYPIYIKTALHSLNLIIRKIDITLEICRYIMNPENQGSVVSGSPVFLNLFITDGWTFQYTWSL